MLVTGQGNMPSPQMAVRGRFFRWFVIAACGVTFAGPIVAQKSHSNAANSSAWKLTAIKVTGSQRYQPSEIIAATGLQIGQTVTEADFQRASKELGGTGAFDNVAYTFRYSSDGAQLQLQVTDSGVFVPARFENFVWFPDQELRAKLHQAVPLFDGMLPLSGSILDQVSDALQLMLVERKIPGQSDYVRDGPEGGAPKDIVFSVTGPNIRIRNVAFTGAGPEELAMLNHFGKELIGRQYSRSLLLAEANKAFVPIFLARGYLKATFAEAQAKVAGESEDQTDVDVTFQIEPGRQYKLTAIQWSGNKAFPLDKLQALIHAQTGQPVNSPRFDADLGAVEKLYGTRGYVAAKVHSTPQFDEGQSAVSYRLEVNEGDVYHMGDIEIQGLDDRDAKVVLAKWSLAKGDLYDSSYPKRFLDDAFKSALIDEKWKVRVSEDPDAKDKTVDVTLRFSRSAL